MPKRLALTKEGTLSWCNSDDEHIGTGRCNHIAHQETNESVEEFTKRAENIQNSLASDNNQSLSSNEDPYADLPEEDKPENVSDIAMAQAIIKALKKTEFKEQTEAALKYLDEYSHHVANMTLAITMLRFKIDDYGIDEYQSRVMDLDNMRKIKHTEAIGKLAYLNSLCDDANLPPIYQGEIDTKDREVRHKIADFIFRLYKNPLISN